ncbi:MAG: MaoC/PaaZ C-terminal domain-containing protein, partial [Burkholderiaceae bacterium]
TEVVERITPRRSLAFAAALGYRQPRYVDDAREGGLEAPPLFCVSLEWPAMTRVDRSAAFGLSADEARRAVHSSQDSEFFMPLRAGQNVRTRGIIEAAHATRAGLAVTVLCTSTDEESGELLCRSRSTSIFRDVTREIPAALRVPVPPIDATAPDDSALAEALRFDRMFPHLYTECAQIWNPIHTERRAALAAGLDDIIVHGTGLWGLAVRRLGELYDTEGSAQYRRLAVRFKAPVKPDAALQLRHQRQGDRVRYELKLQNGASAIVGFIDLA